MIAPSGCIPSGRRLPSPVVRWSARTPILAWGSVLVAHGRWALQGRSRFPAARPPSAGPGTPGYGGRAGSRARSLARPSPADLLHRTAGVSPASAHALCLALVVVDLLARAWRIQWIVQGLGHRMTLRDSFIVNAFGDAACALTPLRLGGEPARLAGMLRSRVPATAAFVAISLEVLAAWPVIIVAAGWLAWRYAPEWWLEAGPAPRRRGGLGMALGGGGGRGERRGVADGAEGGVTRRPPAPPADQTGHRLLAADAGLAARRQHSDELPQPRHPGRDSAGARAYAPPSSRDGTAGGGLVRPAVQPTRAADPVRGRRGGARFSGWSGGRSRWAARAGFCWPGDSTPTASASSWAWSWPRGSMDGRRSGD